jgi:hypothetical protein
MIEMTARVETMATEIKTINLRDESFILHAEECTIELIRSFEVVERNTQHNILVLHMYTQCYYRMRKASSILWHCACKSSTHLAASDAVIAPNEEPNELQI